MEETGFELSSLDSKTNTLSITLGYSKEGIKKVLGYPTVEATISLGLFCFNTCFNDMNCLTWEWELGKGHQCTTEVTMGHSEFPPSRRCAQRPPHRWVQWAIEVQVEDTMPTPHAALLASVWPCAAVLPDCAAFCPYSHSPSKPDSIFFLNNDLSLLVEFILLWGIKLSF